MKLRLAERHKVYEINTKVLVHTWEMEETVLRVFTWCDEITRLSIQVLSSSLDKPYHNQISASRIGLNMFFHITRSVLEI